jgi:hypothetical protein
MAPPPLTDRMPTATAPTTPPDFSWPDFDRWQAAFAAAGIFPPRWEGLQRAPSPQTQEAEAYQFRKLALFYEWLDMLARRPTVQQHYARRGIRARVVRQDERAPCPACDRFNAREVRSGIEAMPPFHPGCRCVLMALHEEPASRRTRS